MFSYSFRVRPLQNTVGNLLAWCDLIIEDTFVVKDFKILQSKTGDVFAAAPSQASNKVDDNGNKQWFPTVYFVDAKSSEDQKRTPAEEEILQAMVKEYQAATKTSSKADTARPAAKAVKRDNPWG